MNSLAIVRWSLKSAAKQPMLWALLLIGLASVPLSSAMSPFRHLGQDTAWALARQWSVVFGMLGGSLALGFLSQHEPFLQLLARGTRTKGELCVLWLAANALQWPLALGAWLVGWGEAGAAEWLSTSLLTGLLVGGSGFIALRIEATATLRVLYLWIFLWVVPGLLA